MSSQPSGKNVLYTAQTTFVKILRFYGSTRIFPTCLSFPTSNTTVYSPGLAVAVSLVVRPPRNLRAATWRLAVGLALMFALGPAERFGYFIYPLGLAGWLILTKRTASGQESPQSPALQQNPQSRALQENRQSPVLKETTQSPALQEIPQSPALK